MSFTTQNGTDESIFELVIGVSKKNKTELGATYYFCSYNAAVMTGMKIGEAAFVVKEYSNVFTCCNKASSQFTRYSPEYHVQLQRYSSSNRSQELSKIQGSYKDAVR